MQALVAPIAGAIGGAAGVAAPATTLATALQAGGAIFSGVAGMQQASAAKEQAKINAYIGQTRAAQTDTAARDGMNTELASMRNTLAAMGQRPGVGTFEIFQELRRERGRERRIEFGNAMSQAADYRNQARAIKPGYALAGGFIKAGPSLFDLYDMRVKG